MCLSTQTHPAARTLLTLGMLCLALSLGSQSLDLTFGLSLSPLHFLRGFLLGLSIVFNLQAVFLARKTRQRS
jgi:hypothetical protein